MSLPPNDQFLLVCAEDSERGLATYAQKQLKGCMIMNRTSDGQFNAFVWNEEKLLWLKQNEEATMKHFFDDNLAPALKKLITKQGERLVLEDKSLTGQQKEDLKDSLKVLKKALSKCNTKVGMKAIFSMAVSDVATEDKLDKYSDCLPLRGGKIISLRTGEIRPRTKEDLWSFEIQANGEKPSEVAQADARHFHENMCHINGTVDQELVKYIQTLCGYSMTMEVTDKALYFLVGISDCGKSEIFRFMLKILGERVGTCQPDVFIEVAKTSTHQTYLVSLLGKSMVFCQELPAGRTVNSDVVKRLRGNDQMSFRRCAAKGAPETFVNQSKLILGSQNMPSIDGGDSGMKTRVRKIPFTRSMVNLPLAERNASLELLKRLETQDGINALFKFWLEGAKRYCKDVSNNIVRIVPPAVVDAENQEFLANSDSFERFLNECCEEWTSASKECVENFTYGRRDLQKDYRKFALGMSYNKDTMLDPTAIPSRMKLKFPGQKTAGPWVGLRKRMEEAKPVAQVEP